MEARSTRYEVTGLNDVIGRHLFCDVRRRFCVDGTYRKGHRPLTEKNVRRLNVEFHKALEALLKKSVMDMQRKRPANRSQRGA